MSNGAFSVHYQLRTELENYIRSQYFSKSPILLSAINDQLDNEGILYQKPYIESSPAYKSINNGIGSAIIPEWLKDFFDCLAKEGLGVYPSPFAHQIKALEAAIRGENLFVATGTGSGKTECFMWPLIAQLAIEAKTKPYTWGMRGVRTIIMYPMNALVSDQVSRLRRLIGDPDNKFISTFRDFCGEYSRRPQFGMYTGRTPYPGPEPILSQDRLLEKTLARMSFPQTDSERVYYEHLLKDGKVPAKADMNTFLSGLHNSKHIPNEEDAELITRFEIQQFCPDILITNYSMLEYMLLRPREAKIWEDTKKWLKEDTSNKLLFIIDEAHMYRGSSGGEVALLVRRLFHKLDISREQVQFILTTASMPDSTPEDKQAVLKFANELTGANDEIEFRYLTGEREELIGKGSYEIPFNKLVDQEPSNYEDKDEKKLEALLAFWKGIYGFDSSITSLDEICAWMYDHLVEYKPFYELIIRCRGNAVSLLELAEGIFPDKEENEALKAISSLLAIAPLAKNSKGIVLFPARMHMLFKGIKGVYACTNPKCSHAHSDKGLTLGEIFLSDGRLICPHCGATVYELYNDRRCGALFYKGYVLEEDTEFKGNVYLWHYPGQLIDHRMKELHLYIPPDDFTLPDKQGKNAINACYLDVMSGFIHFGDDSASGKEGVRKLYYCGYTAKARPQVVTFPTCPHCRHMLSSAQLTSFSTRGNQSFFNLIKAQFQVQPAVGGKDTDPDRLPNEGRKVLLFSDSRQRAAKLARDMSDASDITAARQLFALAVSEMECSTSEQSMNALYDYFCLSAAKHHVQIFHDAERNKFAEDCMIALSNYARCMKRKREYSPRFTIVNAPVKMQEYLLRLFAGGYNTLYDSAICWIEPTEQALFDAVDSLMELGIEVTDEEFLDVFNAWIINVCDSYTALGHTITDEVRLNVRPNYNGYGLPKDWNFHRVLLQIMGWEKSDQVVDNWKRVFKEAFLDTSQPDNGKLYVDLSRIKPRYNEEHRWYKCEQCSEITPYILKKHCPCCGTKNIHEMDSAEYDALGFWRNPVKDALDGEKIRVIDTEEHTAQLSHKDQRDELWSRTEEYELRFQDLITEKETPVDILSSTTTMEVGIDIGSLVAVGLRNIPPMRENYQQRAGRAGRRGASLSTIVTFCEDGPHDTLYFNNPIPMFRGDPRKPWIDTTSEKLLQRHFAMVLFQEYLSEQGASMDEIPAATFIYDHEDGFLKYVQNYNFYSNNVLLPDDVFFSPEAFYEALSGELGELREKMDAHPELFGVSDEEIDEGAKSLLDALYEEGIVPTYSFPKNVVSTYISDLNGKTKYEVERGLDIAIGEYAPGRAIVVDKTTYQIGGFYYPKSERKKGQALTPARAYIEDANYLKSIISCNKCGWFGIADDKVKKCPFCGEMELYYQRPMLRPWGFAPRDATSIQNAQLAEEYTFVQQPLYSTLPDSEEICHVNGYKNMRMASRTNQRIIMMNDGDSNMGFTVCKDCGAAMPGADAHVLDNVKRPYKSIIARKQCKHENTINVNLGYDFVTDMLVLEIELDDKKIDTRKNDNPWLIRAAQSLAEALRLAASKELDIEFTELVTGYRLRKNPKGSFVDVYLYDSLSSGAGYAVSVANEIEALLNQVEELLVSCDCEGACHKCLNHYRNQHLQGRLDRFSALELLHWSKGGMVAEAFDLQIQQNKLMPLKGILTASGCKIDIVNESIVASKKGKEKKIVIYPAMWVEPHEKETVFVSDALIKYSKPYAVQKILDEV